jgi:large subunit ribosomal protein L15
MKLHTLQPAVGSVKAETRIARGQGSGKGGTATRGHKGAQSRSGYSHKKGFEGGQMPLQRRIPKFGFKNFNRVEYKPVNLDSLEKLASEKGISTITPEVLYANGLIGKTDRVKILSRGTLQSKIEVTAHAFSEAAKAKIEEVGGSVAKL